MARYGVEGPSTLAALYFFCRSVKKYGLGSGSVDVSQGMVELVRELGGMVADKQADLEVPYWVADD